MRLTTARLPEPSRNSASICPRFAGARRIARRLRRRIHLHSNRVTKPLHAQTTTIEAAMGRRIMPRIMAPAQLI
jgi:hypothetical protein